MEKNKHKKENKKDKNESKKEEIISNDEYLKFKLTNYNSEYVDVDPMIIHYQHSKIKPEFSDHKIIDETIEELKGDITKINNIPKIQVLIDNDGYLFSLNNRRLYVFKKLREIGIIKSVNVRIKPMNEKEKDRYNRQKCSLTAKFMYKIKTKNEENIENIKDDNIILKTDIDVEDIDK